MKKIMIIASMLLVSVTAGWAVNFFLPASGDWNVNTNWNDGHVPVITDVAQVNQGKTCTIQSGTYGVVSKQFIGADSDGTINVYGEFYFNATFEGLVFGLYNNGVGHGMLNVYDGGVVGTNTTVATDRRNAFVGYTSTSTVNNNRGTVNVYSNGAVYLKEVFVNYDTDNTGVSSINIHDGGLLDVSYNLWLGYNSGAASNAQVTVSGAGHLKVGNLNLGRYNASPLVNTFGTMTVNGSQVNVEISGNLSARSQSIMNFNFDDNGIAAVSALNFFHEGFTMNIVGTENVATGEYWLVQGTSGGPQDQSPTFNISGFNPGSSNEVVKVVDSEGVHVGYKLIVYSNEPQREPLNPFDISVAVGNQQAILSWPGQAGYTYALQSRQELATGAWSNVVSGIVGVNDTIAATNAPSENNKFYRVVAE